jgi:prolyl-tRNA synthetase
MAHSDDNGLILPPKMATNQMVIIPIWKSDDEKNKVLSFAQQIFKELRKKYQLILDDREQYKPGYKFAEWELQGIPLRLEIGPKEERKKQVVLVRRDNKNKLFIAVNDLRNKIREQLVIIQKELLTKARSFCDKNSYEINEYHKFKEQIDNPGGFINAHWCGNASCEQKVKEDTKATIRLIPFDRIKEKGKCIVCNEDSKGRVLFAKAY